MQWAHFLAKTITAGRQGRITAPAILDEISPERQRVLEGAGGASRTTRSRMMNAAPLAHHRPRAKQGPGHDDGVEPLPVAGQLALFQIKRGNRLVGGVWRKYD